MCFLEDRHHTLQFLLDFLAVLLIKFGHFGVLLAARELGLSNHLPLPLLIVTILNHRAALADLETVHVATVNHIRIAVIPHLFCYLSILCHCVPALRWDLLEVVVVVVVGWCQRRRLVLEEGLVGEGCEILPLKILRHPLPLHRNKNILIFYWADIGLFQGGAMVVGEGMTIEIIVKLQHSAPVLRRRRPLPLVRHADVLRREGGGRSCWRRRHGQGLLVEVEDGGGGVGITLCG